MSFTVYPPDAPAMECSSARQTRERLTAGARAWISLNDPAPAQVEELAALFALPPLAVSDVIAGGQRSKLEDYDGVLFLVLRDPVAPGTLTDTYVFAGPNYLIHLTWAGAGGGRHQPPEPDEKFLGNELGLLHHLLDGLVDAYEPVVQDLGERIEDLEDEVFAGAPGVAGKLHRHLRDVLRLQRALHPLVMVCEELAGRADEELRPHLRDVHDHTLRESIRVDTFHDVLASAMQLHIALVGQQQSEEMARLGRATYEQGEQSKKVASWAAILFTPTVIAGIYGMNFHHMPGLSATYGYPLALLAIAGSALILYVLFKRQRWL